MESAGLDCKDVNSRLANVRGKLRAHLSDKPYLRRERWREGTSGSSFLGRPEIGYISNEITRSAIPRSEWKMRAGQTESNTLNEGHFLKHVRGTDHFERYKQTVQKSGYEEQSRLTISYEDAQALVNKYAGSGQPKIGSKMTWARKEDCKAEKPVGFVTFNDGRPELETEWFRIVYANKDTHVIPVEPPE